VGKQQWKKLKEVRVNAEIFNGVGIGPNQGPNQSSRAGQSVASHGPNGQAGYEKWFA
jgi:hypothetical protein